jgi:hypothetical protein
MHTIFLLENLKRTLERLRRRWDDNIRMGLREIGCVGVDWINLAQDRDQWQGSCEQDNELIGSIKREFLD